jgi:predicted XRE-type DNA-binding protein
VKFSIIDYLAIDPVEGKARDLTDRDVRLKTARRERDCYFGRLPGGTPHVINRGDTYLFEKIQFEKGFWDLFSVCVPCMDRRIAERSRQPRILAIDEGDCIVKIPEDSVENVSVVEGSGNVYRDLGFDDADGMAEKATVAMRISELLAAGGITKAQACDTLGIRPDVLEGILKGKFRTVDPEMLKGYEQRLVAGSEHR